MLPDLASVTRIENIPNPLASGVDNFLEKEITVVGAGQAPLRDTFAMPPRLLDPRVVIRIVDVEVIIRDERSALY